MIEVCKHDVYSPADRLCWYLHFHTIPVVITRQVRGDMIAISYLDIVRSWGHSDVFFPHLKLSSEHKSLRHRVKVLILNNECHAISDSK